MSTLKNKLLGLFLLVLAAFIAVQNLQDRPETSKKNSTSLVIKTADKKSKPSKEKHEKQEKQEPEMVVVNFGLKANFGPRPESETQE